MNLWRRVFGPSKKTLKAEVRQLDGEVLKLFNTLHKERERACTILDALDRYTGPWPPDFTVAGRQAGYAVKQYRNNYPYRPYG